MATSSEAEAFAAQQRRLIDAAELALAAWLAENADATPDETVQAILTLVGQFASAVAEHAAAWYTLLRQRAADRATPAQARRFGSGGVPNFSPSPIDAFKAGSIARDTLWALKQQDPAASLAQVIDQHIAQAGKDTIALNAERDPAKPRWARMPVGATCAWCLMLASRGAAYASRKTAGYTVDGTKYHADDDCTPVPVWDHRDLPYDADALYQIYLDASDKAGSDPKAIVAQIRRDHWDTVTDGVVPDPKPADFYDRAARPDYWNRRLQALGLDYGDDAKSIQPEEIITAERLLSRGDRLTPVPVDRGGQPKSTSDYDWTNHETGESVRVEVKSLRDSTRLHKATFPLRVKTAVGRSLEHGERFRKRTFLLDAGDRTVPQDVTDSLRSYNRDNPNATVLRFFLLAGGRITEVVPE